MTARNCGLPSILCTSNISTSTSNDASLSFEYQPSMDFKINAKGPKEAITVFPKNNDQHKNDIIYANQGTTKQMKLYKMVIVNNSLHTYCNTSGMDDRPHAELLMFHKSSDNSGDYLLVCVPIMFTSTTMFRGKNIMPPEANKYLKKILHNAPIKNKNNDPEDVYDINVNTFIPLNKPFFHEQYVDDDGDSCFGIKSKTIMIVFDPKDIYFLLDKESEKHLNTKTIKMNPAKSTKNALWVRSSNKDGGKKKIKGNRIEGFKNDSDVSKSTSFTKDASKMSFLNMNASIAKQQTAQSDQETDSDQESSDTDDIYIDCQPTGNDGKALYEENLSAFKPSLKLGNMKLLNKFHEIIEKIEKSPALWFIIGLIIAFIVVKLGNFAISKTRQFLQKRAAGKLAQ